MYGPILSMLLVGMIPVWGVQTPVEPPGAELPVAAPADPSVASALADVPFSASGVIVMDVDSAQVVYAQGHDTPRAMASLTKLMTALLIAENHPMEEWITIPDSVRTVTGSLAYLPAGQEFRVGDVLSGLLMNSGNDAAVTLAQYHSGSVETFVSAMNQRAVELGLVQTTFANPVGLDDPRQKSSPRDLAWLALYVLRHPEIKERMAVADSWIESRSGRRVNLYHTHLLLHSASAIIAGKTGTTEDAKQCLLSLVESGSRQYLVVLLHSGDRYGDMRAVLSALSARLI